MWFLNIPSIIFIKIAPPFEEDDPENAVLLLKMESVKKHLDFECKYK